MISQSKLWTLNLNEMRWNMTFFHNLIVQVQEQIYFWGALHSCNILYDMFSYKAASTHKILIVNKFWEKTIFNICADALHKWNMQALPNCESGENYQIFKHIIQNCELANYYGNVRHVHPPAFSNWMDIN